MAEHPFGHHHRHHDHHRRDDDDQQNRSERSFHYPPPGTYEQPPAVVHVSHQPPREDWNVDDKDDRHHHHHHRHGGGVVHRHTGHFVPSPEELLVKPTVKVHCKKDPEFALAIRHGKVVLARSDPSDESQKWYKDDKYSTRVKDSEGYPSFSLINKATNEALKHSIGPTHPVQLIPYNSDSSMDESILWTLGLDLGDGYRAMRMINNIRLNVDAFHGDQGVHEGTLIVLWEWNNGHNQQWKIHPTM